jgi:N-acetylgalactosamine kinase
MGIEAAELRRLLEAEDGEKGRRGRAGGPRTLPGGSRRLPGGPRGAPEGPSGSILAPGEALRRFLEDNYGQGDLPAARRRYLRLVDRLQALRAGGKGALAAARGGLRDGSGGSREGSGALQVSLARAPGRINLIGEHTDYNGLPVLPFAIHRDLAAAFAPRGDDRVVLHNLNPAYPPREFRLEPSIPPYATGDWGNYCKAASQGILDHFQAEDRKPVVWRGLDAVIHGDIPPAAGLSSSSALVVLGALMLLAANRQDIPGQQLATLLARAEHYVGTQGGGMDQAASLLSRAGTALKIDFFPLRVTPAPLPPGFAFVAADSLVKAPKTAEALDKYNRRPIECRLAVAVLRRRLAERFAPQIAGSAPASLPGSAREVPLERLGDLAAGAAGIPAGELRAEADRSLHEAPYTLAEIGSILGRTPQEAAREYCLRRDGTVFPEPEDGFKLHARYRHVVEEGRRVEQALAALRQGDVAGLGRLMDQSHASCRDLYEISCPELESLTAIAREAGAEGSRLTGAGFGGCTISLVREDRLDGFLRRTAAAYYRGFLRRGEEELSSILFPCRAVNGAQTLF